MLFKCDCNEKQYSIKTKTIKNIIQHIKKVNIVLLIKIFTNLYTSEQVIGRPKF
jgi:hypothetical protein